MTDLINKKEWLEAAICKLADIDDMGDLSDGHTEKDVTRLLSL